MNAFDPLQPNPFGDPVAGGDDPTVEASTAPTQQHQRPPLPGGLAGAFNTMLYGADAAQRMQEANQRAVRQGRRDERIAQLRLVQQWAITVAICTAAVGVGALVVLIIATWSAVW